MFYVLGPLLVILGVLFVVYEVRIADLMHAIELTSHEPARGRLFQRLRRWTHQFRQISRLLIATLLATAAAGLSLLF
jgi:hypothetical protein